MTALTRSLPGPTRRLPEAYQKASRRLPDADAGPEDRYEIALMAHVDPDVIPKPPTPRPQAAQHKFFE